MYNNTKLNLIGLFLSYNFIFVITFLKLTVFVIQYMKCVISYMLYMCVFVCKY